MARPIVALLLTAALAASGGTLFDRAEHEWTLILQPHGPAPYTLDVPFLSSSERPDAVRVLDALRSTVRVVDGTATFEWLEDGHVLRVHAEGPAILSARHAYGGDVGEREAFTRWTISHDEVRRADSGGPAVDLTWSVDFSGGRGHTCWADLALTAHVASDATTAPLVRPPDEPGPGWGVVCA